MKEFDPPQVCISQEEYDQLQECKRVAESLWRIYGPYNFPKELQERTSEYPNKYPRSVRGRLELLMEFDDSE
tara:strand:+ start:267 stop:482 length:216 start_codon:yes stop_codon:yes gene_type:complete